MLKYEREAVLHKRLSRKLQIPIDELHYTKGRIYFWSEDINYFITDEYRDEVLVRDLDIELLNTIRWSISDYSKVYDSVREFRLDLSKARAEAPISYYVPLVVAMMNTNFLQEVPFTELGASSLNPFYLTGQNKCYTKAGSLPLATYSTYKDSLIDLATRYNLSYDEEDTFKRLYDNLHFSLTLYRAYFILVPYIMRGVNINGRLGIMDSFGSIRGNRHTFPKKTKESFFGRNLTTGKRPVGVFATTSATTSANSEGRGGEDG